MSAQRVGGMGTAMPEGQGVPDDRLHLALDGFNGAAAPGERFLISRRDQERMRAALAAALEAGRSGEAASNPKSRHEEMQEWARQNPSLVYGWAAATWEGRPDLRDHETSMHMIPLVPVWRVVELESALEDAASKGEDMYEEYVASLIDHAPDVRALGERLAEVLDESDFNAVNPTLLGLAEKIAAAPQQPPPVGVTDGLALIAAERRRQVEVEGWTPEHDAEHHDDAMAAAAACYAAPRWSGLRGRGAPPNLWPWDSGWWKPGDDSTAGRIRELTKAGALIAAEIDRLSHQQPAPSVSEESR